VRWRLKYIVGGGYANVNIAFYRTFERVGEKKLQFNVKAAPFIIQGIKRIGLSRWYVGLRYVLFKSSLQYNGSDTLGELGSLLERSQLVSELGPVIEIDKRDNIFTPDKGFKFHMDAVRSDNIFGSDFDFWRINYYGYGYLPLARGLTGGLRLDGAQSTGDIPFYLQPYINMRGVPAMRYQGKATILTEGELRWDFVRRWSAVVFSGVGKAFDEWSEFGSAKWVVSYGTGFRYFLARKFKLRVGIDIAHGADGFAYYIIFGSNWLR
jgi:outer membrane protein assembly factor BamA